MLYSAAKIICHEDAWTVALSGFATDLDLSTERLTTVKAIREDFDRGRALSSIARRLKHILTIRLHDLSGASTWAESEPDGSDHDMVEVGRDTRHREYLCRLRQDVFCRVSPRNVGQKEPFHAARGCKARRF
jgi:hypothetical protein